jgi:hypothetical protein
VIPFLQVLMKPTTKHTSTDLEQLDARIKDVLKNLSIPETVFAQDLEDLTVEGVRRFAENGELTLRANAPR